MKDEPRRRRSDRFLDRDVAADVDEELRFHLDARTQEYIEQGMDPDRARAKARRRFGDIEAVRRSCVGPGRRAQRLRQGRERFRAVLRDIRHAFRRLAKQPHFSVPVVASLALGIGAAAAILTLVNAVLLRPLPYRDAERLVALGHAAPGFGIDEAGQSSGTYLHYRENNRVFEDLGLYYESFQVLTDTDSPERIRVSMTTTSVLPLLRVEPVLGRLFTEEDAERDELVVIIGHDLWIRRYGADPDILGRRIEINAGSPRQVIGVMPPGFDFPHPETQLWWGHGAEPSSADVRDLWRSGIARLRDGVSVRAAEADLQRLVPSLAAAYADVTPELIAEGQLRATVVPLKETVVGEARSVLIFLLATAAFVFLLVLANVINLTLVRAERERGAVAVEQALGAGGHDLMRRFFGEGLILATVGGALGLGLAYLAVQSHFGFELGEIPRLHELRFDGFGLAVTAALVALSGFVLGAVSLVWTRRAHFVGLLKGAAGQATAGPRAQRAQRLLGAVQVALALTLLIGSAIMAESFWKLRQVELGFEPENVLALDIPLPTRGYPSYHDATGFQARLLDRLRALPGVQAAETTEVPPLASMPTFGNMPVVPADRPPGAHEIPLPASINSATPGYFEMMGIPLLRGRTFQADDIADAPAAILSQTLADRLVPSGDPIGQRVRLTESPRQPALTIVGVVGDVPAEDIAAGPVSTVYFPILHDPTADREADVPLPVVPRWLTVVVRTDMAPTSLMPTLRDIVRGLDPTVPIAHARTMEQAVDESMARRRLTALLLFIAATTALSLGVIGVYGVVSYGVSQRTSEFGIRVALGATPTNVNGMVLRQGAIIAAIGVAAGLLAAFSLTRFLRGLLYEVSPTDATTFTVTSVALFAIVMLASLVPAHRAGRVDPVRALKAS